MGITKKQPYVQNILFLHIETFVLTCRLKSIKYYSTNFNQGNLMEHFQSENNGIFQWQAWPIWRLLLL